MKPPRLAPPPEVAPLIASVRRSPAPSEETKDRLRARLGWAFIETGTSKVQYPPQPQSLQVMPPAARRTMDRYGWIGAAVQAAAALVLGHIPLALAGLAIAVAAVPVTRRALNRAAESRATTRQISHTTRPAPQAVRQPSSPPVPPLAPLPQAFIMEQPTSAPPDLVPPSPAPRVLPPPGPAPAMPGDDVSLGVERQLLDRGRLSLVRGDAVGALADLDEHRRRYPESQLSEVREALTVQALLRSGRVAEARSHEAEFRRRYPSSLLLPALDAALHE